MSRRRRHQQFDACSRLFMPSPCAAVLHIRRHDVSRRRQCARLRQVGYKPGPVHPSCVGADSRLLRNATIRWDGVDSCPSPARFVRHTGRTSSGPWTHVPPPLSSFATQVERALGNAWRSAHPCANTPRDSCSLHRSSYVAASVLIMRSRVGLINCFIAANAPRNRYEKQSWLFQRPHGQQR